MRTRKSHEPHPRNKLKIFGIENICKISKKKLFTSNFFVRTTFITSWQQTLYVTSFTAKRNCRGCPPGPMGAVPSLFTCPTSPVKPDLDQIQSDYIDAFNQYAWINNQDQPSFSLVRNPRHVYIQGELSSNAPSNFATILSYNYQSAVTS